MNCPHCQTANPDGAKFCMNCGRPLVLACPNCNTELPAAAKFCFNCGQRLEIEDRQPATGDQSPIPDGTSDNPQSPMEHRTIPNLQSPKYMPADLADKLESARANRAMAGERRIVTILFCDVKGSTALAEQLDPEEWTEIMNQAFEHLIAPIYRYEGTVARLMGDAILAFFGAPIAHEDDPQRAVLAGLDIVSSIQPFRERVRQKTGLDFNVRVGINTGLVVVGEVGSDLRMEYTAMGDAINLAARMEQSAVPGTVQIAAETYRLVAPLFDFQALGSIEIKGKRNPVPAYRVLGRKARPGRLRGIEGLDAPLIGRERELAALQAAALPIQQGIGAIVCLLGEAGLGKSRLIAELHQSIANSQTGKLAWFETSAMSHEMDHPYWLFRQLLRQVCQIEPNESPEEVRRKLDACLSIMAAEARDDMYQAFTILLAPAGDPDQAPLEGEAFKRRLFDAMLALWRERAAAAANVLVFDDLHWADPASVELLLTLFRLTDEVPLLFVCAMRPARQAAGWRVKQTAETDYPHRYAEVRLSPLSTGDSSALIDSLLSISDLPDRLRHLILEKAEGNPFFVEEVVRTLIDSGAVVQDESGRRWHAAAPVDDIAIPGSLQALIMARIDRLEEETRYTLQLASVIGRSFYYRVLDLLTDMGPRLDPQLNTLQRVELIREVARLPELEFIFRHALTQEAAYNTILLKQRRQFHRRVGEVMERLFADRLEEFASLLGRHFFEAGDMRAFKYYSLAGDAAMRVYANTEAAEHYRLALQCAQQSDVDSSQLQPLYLQRGRALELNSQYALALANYQEMEENAQRRGNQSLELAALLGQATIRNTANPVMDATEGQRLLRRALDLAHAVGDGTAEVKIAWNLMLANAISGGDVDERTHYGESALALARRLDLRQQMAFILHDLWYAYGGAGQWRRAAEALAEARQLWLELNNLAMLAATLTRVYMTYLFEGDYEPALAYSDEAFRISTESNDLESQALSRFIIGLIYFERGQPSRAIACMEEALALGEPINNITVLINSRVDLAWFYGWLGAAERGLALAQQSRA